MPAGSCWTPSPGLSAGCDSDEIWKIRRVLQRPEEDRLQAERTAAALGVLSRVHVRG